MSMSGQQSARLSARLGLALAVLVGVGGLMSRGASATTLPSNFTLQDLINLGSTGVVVGDKQFFNFSYLGSPVGGANPAPTASEISVGVAPGSDIGLRFSTAWQADPGLNQDSLISYAVTVLDPGSSIDGVNLDFNGDAPLTGVGTNACVSETVWSLTAGGGPGTLLGQLSTFNEGAIGGSLNRDASSLALSPIKSLYLSKDIQVHSTNGGQGGISTISFVDNSFSQDPVPEPTTLGLIGVAGVALLRRRRA